MPVSALPVLIAAGGSVTLPLGASAGVSSASLALTAKTQVPLGTCPAVAAATLAIKAPIEVPLAASAAAAAATLALRAPTYLWLHGPRVTTDFRAHGKSFVLGEFGLGPGFAFPLLVARDKDLVLTNQGVAGAILASNEAGSAPGGVGKVLQTVTAPADVAARPARRLGLMMYGYNDAFTYGTSNLLPFKEALRTAISRHRASAVFEADNGSLDSSIVLDSAVWLPLADATKNSGDGYRYTTGTPGARIVISVPSSFRGGTIALGFLAARSWGHVVTVTVDGVTHGTLNTSQDGGGNPKTFSASGDGEYNDLTYRIEGLAKGGHTITAVLTTYGAGFLIFDYWQIEPDDAVEVLVVGQYKVRHDGGAGNDLADADVTALNTAIQDVVAEFDTGVTYVETDSYIGQSLTYLPVGGGWDGVHPSAAGHARLAEAVEAQMAPVPRASSASLALTAPTQIPLGTSAGLSAATLTVVSPMRVPLAAAAAQSAATLSLVAQTEIPLGASAGQSDATLDLTAESQAEETEIPLDPADAVSTATLGLTAPTLVPLDPAAAVSTTSLGLRAPALLSLNSAGQSDTTLTVIRPVLLELQAAAQSAATLELFQAGQIPLGACNGVSTARISLRAGIFKPGRVAHDTVGHISPGTDGHISEGHVGRTR